MSSPRRFLIVGATGKQGGAVVNSLLEARAKLPSDQQFSVVCLTHDAYCPKARSLASRPGVSTIDGDIMHPAKFLEHAGPISGVFCMTAPGKAGDEEIQAIALIDASIRHGVKHFVFTSVDRGGEDVSEKTPTNVPHFESKHKAEAYLKEKAREEQITWTILRPVAFMDNFTPDFIGKAFARLWAQLGDKPLQVVACKDIGHFGAAALLEPEKYKDRAIGLAGDELTFEQASKIFKDTLGYEMPMTWGIIGTAIKWGLYEIGVMFEWFKTGGFRVDIQKLRNEYPELQDFKTWLKEESGFEPRQEIKS